MLFNSLQFGIFLVIVFALHWALPQRARTPLLLLSSLFFYMCWNPKYVLLILFTILSSYLSGVWIEKGREAGRGEAYGKRFVAFNTLACLAVLFFFKYFNLFSSTLAGFFHREGFFLNVVLPVGISFYTFQTLSYVIDVYRGTIRAERDPLAYACYVSFFPQLVAGPIERSGNLLPQIKSERHFDYDEAVYGLKLMAWGYYKKLVIADALGVYVDRCYENLYAHSGIDLLIVIFFFTLQIYCDFSGYSDIAIGTARLFGIRLMRNFNSPYLALSISEFWKRWHISLSSWFSDYVYTPLVYRGKRKGKTQIKLRMYFSLVTTFLISGFWHGAAWHFAFWGLIHGILQVLEDIFKKPLKKLKKKKAGRFVSWLFVFLLEAGILVFFRAASLQDAMHVFLHMFDGIGSGWHYNHIDLWPTDIAIIVMTLIPLCAFDLLNLKRDVIEWTATWKRPLRYMLYAGILVFILLFREAGVAEFVYFQF
ncbi:MAG: MBOAT family protein [Lachnospiraceae bacterium]|nr:MBOAT family protein [Lachnospiraceae bacterium]